MKQFLLILILLLMSCYHHCGKYKPTMDLHEAVRSGSTIAVQQALLAGADVNQKDSHGFTPLDTSLFKRDFEICELLIDSGADINMGCQDVLIACLLDQKMDLFEKYLKKGAYVDHVIYELYTHILTAIDPLIMLKSLN